MSMKNIFSDYAALAAESDEYYQKFSPLHHQQFYNTNFIEFPLNGATDLPLPPEVEKRNSKILQRVSSGLRSVRHSPFFQGESWKWSLWRRQHFEKVLRDFRKHNKELSRLVPLMMACNPRFNQLTVVEELEAECEPQHDALQPHLVLRRLALLERGRAVVDDHAVAGSIEAEEEPLKVGSISLARSISLPLRDAVQRPDPGRNGWDRTQYQVEEATPTIIEYKDYGELEYVTPRGQDCFKNVQNQVAQLVKLLSTAGEFRLHTLPLQTHEHQPGQKRFVFVFDYPLGSLTSAAPVSLRDMFNEKELPLHLRFKIASVLAEAIGSFHADGWVHKSIRSASVKFFQKTSGRVNYPEPYLVGFEYSRPEEAATANTGEFDVENNLYRHPNRQGNPTVKFNRTHDIYALGVVLLEIGLWKTAFSWYHEQCKTKREGVMINAVTMQRVFIKAATANLDRSMGTAYKEAVLTCLNCELQSTTMSPAQIAIGFKTKVLDKVDFRSLELHDTDDL